MRYFHPIERSRPADGGNQPISRAYAGRAAAADEQLACGDWPIWQARTAQSPKGQIPVPSGKQKIAFRSKTISATAASGAPASAPESLQPPARQFVDRLKLAPAARASRGSLLRYRNLVTPQVRARAERWPGAAQHAPRDSSWPRAAPRRQLGDQVLVEGIAHSGRSTLSNRGRGDARRSWKAGSSHHEDAELRRRTVR